MNSYALDIGYKTDLKLPNGKRIILNEGDKLEFTMIDDRDEKETVVEERFYINKLDWRDDLMHGIKYTIAESRYLDRIDKAHINPDMLINKHGSRELGYLRMGILEGTNKIKISIPSGKFYSIPEAIDIILIRDNCKEKNESASSKEDKAHADIELAFNEIKDIIRKYKLDNILFKIQEDNAEKATVSIGTSYITDEGHKRYVCRTDIAMIKELYEEN